MYVSSNENWIRYSQTGDWKLSNIKDGGKWMHFYKERDFAKAMIEKALAAGIVKYAKHTKGRSGIVCYYVSGTSLSDHYRVINFMLENNLIRLTSNLNYFDVSFKFNGQSWSKEYGPNFEGLIKLSNLIDLATGKPKYQGLSTEDSAKVIDQLLTITSINRKDAINNDAHLSPLLSCLDQFVINKVHKLFKYDQINSDLNDKIIYLAPSGYNLRLLYNCKDVTTLLRLSAHLISYLLLTASSKQRQIIDRLQAKNNPDANLLISILNSTLMQIDDQNHIEKVDYQSADKFVTSFNHALVDEQFANIISYLLLISLEHISKPNIDFLVSNINPPMINNKK